MAPYHTSKHKSQMKFDKQSRLDEKPMLKPLLRSPSLRKSSLYRSLVTLLLFFCVYLLLPYRIIREKRSQPHGPILFTQNVNRSEITNFWVAFESHLRDAQPGFPRIKADRHCSLGADFRTPWLESFFTRGACNRRDMIFHPGQHERPRADHIRLSDESFNDLKSSHQSMVTTARQFAPRLPYQKGTSGVVMIGGDNYSFLALLSLRMLRLTGSKLPVEVFLVSEAEDNANFCKNLLPPLGAKCRSIPETLSATPQAQELSQYQYKSLAILFSSFDNVFFLDADALVALQPDDVFGSDPFNSTGLVTWPDLWAESSSPIFFQMAGLPVPPVRRYSSDSGVILYSKNKHAASLLLATYYNYYGPDYYYPLLSQGAHGQGDKETYLHAAAALRMDFWDIKTPLWEIGRWLTHDKFKRVGMGQHHPEDDYKYSGESSHGSKRRIRPFVLHINNPFKLTPKMLFKPPSRSPLWQGSQRTRILGTKEDMLDTFGYDFEARMWEQLKEVACDLHIGCDDARAHYDAVFGSRLVASGEAFRSPVYKPENLTS